MRIDRTLASAVRCALVGGFRLFTLRPARRADFAPSAELFALLVSIDLLLLFAVAVAAVGLQGELNLYELPRALMFVPLVLALGVIAARFDEEGELLRVPVALAAATLLFTLLTSLLYLLAMRQWLPFAEMYWAYFDYFALAWSGLVVVIAVMSLTTGRLWGRAMVAVAGLVVLVLPSLWMPMGLLWMPRYDDSSGYASASFHSLAAESSFYAQHDALERELDAIHAERPGIADIYLVAAALYAGEDVFMKEVEMISALFRERFDTEGRTVHLVNNGKTIHKYPVASLTSLRETLIYVGETMNVDEDVLLLYVSSHGSEKHELMVDFRPLRFSPITPASLKAALDESGIKWKVVVVSACYSGGFIDALKDPHTMVITASSAERQSFGCGNLSDATYLAQALFDQALRQTYSFETAFERARVLIGNWEKEKNFTASEPQIHVGSDIRTKLAELERSLASRTAGTK